MKATSFVMTHYQKPMTLLGFPVAILLVAAMSSIMTMMLSFPLFGGFVAFGLLISNFMLWGWLNRRLFRHDHHADLVLLRGHRRWGFGKKHITMSAGNNH